MRERIERTAASKPTTFYGLSENHRPRSGQRVPRAAGLHVFEDHFYPEIIDPKTCEVLPKAPRESWC